MTWIKSDPRLPSSPKFLDLVSRLKVGPQDAFWNLHHLWYWCSDHYPEGMLKDVSDVAIAYSAKWPGEPKTFVDALVCSGFLDRGDGALFIHDWDEWRSEPVIKRSVRQTAAVRTPRGGQEEKKESFLPSSPSSPTPPSSTPCLSSKERKEELFAQFWAAYPRKKSKGQALRAWQVLKPDLALTLVMIQAIAKAKNSHDWTKDRGDFIPYPATWLRARGWEDEIDAPVGSVKADPQALERKAAELRARANREWEKREAAKRAEATT